MANNPTDTRTNPDRRSGPTQSGPDTAGLDQAFQALRTYDAGSSRGALRPIDAVVVRALADPRGRPELEGRLAEILNKPAPVQARLYVCAQLRLVGGVASVGSLSSLLADPAVADAARSALQTLPGLDATRALRAALTRLTGPQLLGAIDSLGKRRDPGSVSVLVRFLTSADPATTVAAAAALGEIGTPKATRALRLRLVSGPLQTRPAIADACLLCAERLHSAGRSADARGLYTALTVADCPPHIRAAAAHALEPASARP